MENSDTDERTCTPHKRVNYSLWIPRGSNAEAALKEAAAAGWSEWDLMDVAPDGAEGYISAWRCGRAAAVDKMVLQNIAARYGGTYEGPFDLDERCRCSGALEPARGTQHQIRQLTAYESHRPQNRWRPFLSGTPVELRREGYKGEAFIFLGGASLRFCNLCENLFTLKAPMYYVGYRDGDTWPMLCCIRCVDQFTEHVSTPQN